MSQSLENMKNKIGFVYHFGAGAAVTEAPILATGGDRLIMVYLPIPLFYGHLAYSVIRALTEKNLTFSRWLLDTLAFYAGAYGMGLITYDSNIYIHSN